MLICSIKTNPPNKHKGATCFTSAICREPIRLTSALMLRSSYCLVQPCLLGIFFLSGQHLPSSSFSQPLSVSIYTGKTALLYLGTVHALVICRESQFLALLHEKFTDIFISNTSMGIGDKKGADTGGIRIDFSFGFRSTRLSTHFTRNTLE